MSLKIAVAGKGGCGKTSISALAVRYLKKHGKVPILAVDADPNSNLGESLGLTVRQTIGTILDSFQHEKIRIPPGLTKEAYLEIKLNESIVESTGLDLVTMGRGQGPECYCYPNTVLKKFVENLSKGYASVVMDNEAGLEHLSRKTAEDMDVLLLVSNHSVKGIRAIARVRELVAELKLTVRHQMAVVNMVPPGGLDELVGKEMEALGIKADALIHLDPELARFDLEQKPLITMPDTATAVRELDGLMDRVTAIA